MVRALCSRLPHLIEWHKQFAADGLIIIGVTKYYGIGWDSENERTTGRGSASNSDEQVAVAKFAKQHELPYKLALDRDDGALSNQFGVEGIPQIVLVDRKGVVRMVRVGTSDANSAEIASKIKALLSETP
jgi:hypothetical protein